MTRQREQRSGLSLSPSGPRILVNGIEVHPGDPRPGASAKAAAEPVTGPAPPQALPRWRLRRPGRFSLLALAGVAATLIATAFLAACAGSSALTLRKDGSVGVSVEASLPPALAAKLRKLSSLPDSTALFDYEGARKAAAGRTDVRLLALSAPGPDALAARLEVPNLAALGREPEVAASGILGLAKGPGWSELTLHLERGKVAALAKYLPGLDQDLLEALSPPALYDDPVTVAEYRRMLSGILGEKALAALDGARWTLSLAAPGNILQATGGKATGQTLTVTYPILDLLVLEKPLDLSLRWAD